MASADPAAWADVAVRSPAGAKEAKVPTLEEMLVWRSGPVAAASSTLRHVARTYAEAAEGLHAFVNGEDFTGYAAKAEERSRRALADDLMDMSRALDNAGWDLHAIAEAIEELRPGVCEASSAGTASFRAQA